MSVGDLIFFLSKQTLLRALQIAQKIAARPIMNKFSLQGMNLSHQNQYWYSLVGLQSALITQATKLQMYFAKEHSKNRWEMFSSRLQKQQDLIPCHFLLSDYL
jgi:hypothetical protein